MIPLTQAKMQIPELDSLSQQPVKTQAKKKPPRKRWNRNFTLLNVEFPKQLVEKTKTKVFQNTVIYLDDKGKRRKKNIMFGDRTDYIFNHNEDLKLKRHQRLGKKDDPFHPNFHKLHFANTEKTIEEAYITFQKKLASIRAKNLELKQ